MTDKTRRPLRRQQLPESASRPMVTPIFPSVVYRTPDPDALDDLYEGRSAGYSYAREGHPNASQLATLIDGMEGTTGGIITGSGMSAITSALLASLGAGDRVLAGDQLYGRSLRLLTSDFPRLGIAADLADPTDATAFGRAVTGKTRAILIELVSNPTLRIADFTAIARIAREHALTLIVDNTFTTPRAFQPLGQGADIVVHSVTKLLAGHADVTLGYAAARDPAHGERLRDIATTWGLSPAPQECWLAERGLYTFDLRFDQACRNAAFLADRLADHAGVEAVFYPGRADHPDHARAKALFGATCGNMVSFRIGGGRVAANALTRAAPRIAFAPTLGDVSTTLSHPASSSHRALPAATRVAFGITEGFFRLSVGIEDAATIWRELQAAIDAASAA